MAWNAVGVVHGQGRICKTIEHAGMVMWRFNAEGKIDRRWSQIDTAAWFKQLD